MQARGGELMDALEGDRLVALADGDPVGLVTWLVDARSGEAEIRALAVTVAARGSGIGRALLAAAQLRLREAGVRRGWVVTTNDNLAALALYQKAGYRLAELRAGAVDQARRSIKPSIPAIGEHGIPLRDELELELTL